MERTYPYKRKEIAVIGYLCVFLALINLLFSSLNNSISIIITVAFALFACYFIISAYKPIQVSFDDNGFRYMGSFFRNEDIAEIDIEEKKITIVLKKGVIRGSSSLRFKKNNMIASEWAGFVRDVEILKQNCSGINNNFVS